MQFDLSEEQQLLKDTLTRLIEREYDFAARRNRIAEGAAWNRGFWTQLAELGVLGMTFEEEHGGSGSGPVETMIVMEQLGRALAVEPYLGCIVLCGEALRRCASPEQKDRWLPRLAQGESLLAYAHHEAAARYDPVHVETAATATPDGFTLSGTKGLVLGGDTAECFVVSARISEGEQNAPLALFLVDAGSAGVEVRGHGLHDGRRAAEVAFDKVEVPREAQLAGDDCRPLILSLHEAGLAAVCAEAVGAMQGVFDLTVDYLKTRKQFGREIGSFQSLQHRAADMLVAIEEARSMALYATMMLGEPHENARSKALSAAKVQVNRSARVVGQQAVQLHGAVGMTVEHAASHYLKRLTVIEIEFGDSDHHLRAVAGAGSLLDDESVT